MLRHSLYINFFFFLQLRFFNFKEADKQINDKAHLASSVKDFKEGKDDPSLI